MKKNKYVFLILLILAFPKLQADRGIAIACNDNYISDCLPSLAFLRYKLKSKLPIEIWYAGDELSELNKQKLRQIGGITFHDMIDYFGGEAATFRGYQIKGYMLKASNFDQVIIADADVYFMQQPEKLFTLEDYEKTGAYFFRDILIKTFQDKEDDLNETIRGCFYWKHGFIESYRARRDYFRSLIQQPSSSMPEDFNFFWNDTEPTYENPFLFHYQESGVVVVDKRQHARGVNEIFKLNRNFQDTYHYVMGDKETYWLGMEMAGEAYSFNKEMPVRVKGEWILYGIKRKKIRLAHTINGELFWFQKRPIVLGDAPFIIKSDETMRSLEKSEVDTMNQLVEFVDMFTTH